MCSEDAASTEIVSDVVRLDSRLVNSTLAFVSGD